MAVQRIKRDDTVEVLAGKDRGKRGKVRRVLLDEHKAIVADINVAKRHQKPGRAGARQAGIIDLEVPLDASNLALVCTKCGRPTRVGSRALEDGTRVRYCKRCGELT
ncbi:MAG: 50S ribosomal protein L24 [Chloroflexi bacterium]|nr:50S ribosomal protein L24 [Chloroflexota bacterium]